MVRGFDSIMGSRDRDAEGEVVLWWAEVWFCFEGGGANEGGCGVERREMCPAYDRGWAGGGVTVWVVGGGERSDVFHGDVTTARLVGGEDRRERGV